ncbi:MAG: YciI family protein [Asticcacaulis sp.]
MFLLSLTYKVPNDEVDRHLDAHKAWLKEGYEAGLFLASGRKVPRTGGMIFAKGRRAEIDAMARKDPFYVNGVAEFTISEININMTSGELEGLKAA